MDIQTENAVLYCIVESPDMLYDAIRTIKIDDFSSSFGKQIYNAIITLLHDGGIVDETLLKNSINSEKFNKKYDEIKNSNIDISNYHSYVKALKKTAIYDAAKKIMTNGLKELGKPMSDPEEIVKNTESGLINLFINKSDASFISASDAIDNVVDKIYSEESFEPKIKTGITALDEKFRMNPGDFIVIGGRPSMGKSSVGLNIMSYTSFILNKPTAMLSIEMPAEQQWIRLLQHITQIPYYKFYDNKRLTSTEHHLIEKAQLLIKKRGLLKIDENSKDILSINAVCKREKIINPDLAGILVDYTGMLLKTNDTVAEMTGISRNLKLLARELNIPVIAFSQLSRQCEMRENKRPRLSDLRESGALEQDADGVIFCYRQEYYSHAEQDKGKIELIVAKQRNGWTGTIETPYNKETCTFNDIHKLYPPLWKSL